MKHDLKITLILLFLFLGAHVIGLLVVDNYLPVEKQLPFGIEKPQADEQTAYIPILIALAFATILALFLIRLKAIRVWKIWFFLSIFIALLISFGAFVPGLIALVLALIFAFYKTFRPSILIHNFTELFIYGGLAGLFVPILGIFSIIILLIIISIYDMIAVWKTKHMISMAKFQSESKMFAGLSVPYNPKINLIKNVKGKKVYREAILGGGDIAFPLLFSGVILKNFGFLPAIITTLTAAIALFLLFIFAEKKKFYPAMPFITLGCLAGYFLVLLIF